MHGHAYITKSGGFLGVVVFFCFFCFVSFLFCFVLFYVFFFFGFSFTSVGLAAIMIN